jgi:hypothetical protein
MVEKVISTIIQFLEYPLLVSTFDGVSKQVLVTILFFSDFIFRYHFYGLEVLTMYFS